MVSLLTPWLTVRVRSCSVWWPQTSCGALWCVLYWMYSWPVRHVMGGRHCSTLSKMTFITNYHLTETLWLHHLNNDAYCVVAHFGLIIRQQQCSDQHKDLFSSSAQRENCHINQEDEAALRASSLERSWRTAEQERCCGMVVYWLKVKITLSLQFLVIMFHIFFQFRASKLQLLYFFIAFCCLK